jgi:signal transduction histidine kinase
MTILRRRTTNPSDRRATEAFAFRDLRVRLQRIGLRRILVGLDLAAIGFVAAAYFQLGPPELLFHFVFVVLAVDAFVFGRTVTYQRIAASSLAMLGYVLLPIFEQQIAPLDLTEWPLMFTIAIVVAWMADRERTAVHRYAGLYRAARERLVTAAEQERKRLSRDLHDGIGQTLTALSLAIDGASSADPKLRRTQLRRARRLAESALVEVRSTAERVRPPRLEERGLESALQEMARSCGEAATLQIERGVADGLTPEVTLEVFRIAQEALANAVRHAASTEIRLTLEPIRGGLLLQAVDNGRGFDPSQVGPQRLGLAGMRERAATIGASLRVTSAAGRGTRVALLIPLSAATSGLDRALAPNPVAADQLP